MAMITRLEWLEDISSLLRELGALAIDTYGLAQDQQSKFDGNLYLLTCSGV